MEKNDSKFFAIQVRKSREGLAMNDLLKRVVAHTSATFAQQAKSNRPVLTTWVVIALILEYAIQQAGGVEALAKVINAMNERQQAESTHKA